MVLQKPYVSKKGKTVYVQLGIWKKGNIIHIANPKTGDFHTTVNNREGSLRCHKNLYQKLKNLLEENGCC